MKKVMNLTLLLRFLDKGEVAVRKTGRGKVLVEGEASETYYTVRKEIYGLHALVEA